MKKLITRVCVILAGMFVVLAPVAANPSAGCFVRASQFGNMVDGRLQRIETATFTFNGFLSRNPCTGLFGGPTPVALTSGTMGTTGPDGEYAHHNYFKIEYTALGLALYGHGQGIVFEIVSDIETISNVTRKDAWVCENYGVGRISGFHTSDIPVDYGKALLNPWLVEYDLGQDIDLFIAVENAGNCNTLP